TTDVTGSEFENEPVNGEKRLFRYYLAVDLARYSREGKKFNPDVHRQHIFGLHVANYMTTLKEENSDLYAKQFSRFVKAVSTLFVWFEALYKAAPRAIRAYPTASRTDD
ncbi:unnamed protein product, partial [Rotaria sp. Silwood1]